MPVCAKGSFYKRELSNGRPPFNKAPNCLVIRIRLLVDIFFIVRPLKIDLLLISSMFIGDKSFDKRLLLAAFKLSADSVPDSLLPFLSKAV